LELGFFFVQETAFFFATADREACGIPTPTLPRAQGIGDRAKKLGLSDVKAMYLKMKSER
jgi:hypothetical protein